MLLAAQYLRVVIHVAEKVFGLEREAFIFFYGTVGCNVINFAEIALNPWREIVRWMHTSRLRKQWLIQRESMVVHLQHHS